MSTDNDSSQRSNEPKQAESALTVPRARSVLAEDGISRPVVSTKDNQIAELQEKLADQADKKNEVTFWLSTLSVVLADCLILPSQPWLIMVVIVVLELLVGIHFANKMGLEKIAIMLDSLGKFVGEHLKRDK